MKYLYITAEFPEFERVYNVKPSTEEHVESMEDFDLHPDFSSLRFIEDIKGLDGDIWGIWNGGAFGLASNQVIIVTAWDDKDAVSRPELKTLLADNHNLSMFEFTWLSPTSRPTIFKRIDYGYGIVVFRWVKMRPQNADSYVALSKPSWKYFEEGRQAHTVGLFKEDEINDDVQRLLIVTWYPDFTEWEATRNVGREESIIHAKRSALEINHNGLAARFVPDR